jgi:3-dehydroquinate dehydratase II
VARVLVLHGPNLQLLGTREPTIYGSTTLPELDEHLRKVGAELGLEVECLQSNHEGVLLDAIANARGRCDALILNAGAYTHTSIALRDALSAVEIPAYEVHLSNIFARESFRHHSHLSGVCVAVISGLGPYSYEAALRAIALRPPRGNAP